MWKKGWDSMSNVGPNPNLDYTVKNILLITDIEKLGNSQLRVVKLLEDLFRKIGISPIGTKQFKDEDVGDLKDIVDMNLDRAIFDSNFQDITEPIDIGIARRYIDDPALLKVMSSRSKLKKALWEQYKLALEDPNTVPTQTIDYLTSYYTHNMPPTHVAYIFFRHEEVAPVLNTDGRLAYHVIAKRFRTFGGIEPIPHPENGTEVPTAQAIGFNAYAAARQPYKKQETYFRHLFMHEVIGHMFSDLPDHFEVPGCTMNTYPSVESLILSASKGNRFCEDCNSRLYLPA